MQETAVLRLVAAGHSNKQVALRLKLGLRSIETHRVARHGEAWYAHPRRAGAIC